LAKAALGGELDPVGVPVLTTHQKLSEFYSKKLLGITALKTQFRDTLVTAMRNFATKSWGVSGLFVAVDLDISVADEFTCVVAPDGVDLGGNMLNPDIAEVTGIQFENANAILYYVALKHATIKSGVELNPRTGAVFYQSEEEIVGTTGAPDSVTATLAPGTGGVMFVDTVCEAGVSNAGRVVRVYLNTPLSSVEAVAFEDCLVAWDGGNNFINVVGNLGQPLGGFSEVAADYTVALLGPTVKRNTNLSADSSYIFLGTVTGGGAGNLPTFKDTSGQRILGTGWLNSLAEILRQDSHGFWKIRVRADTLDSGIEQIVVQDSDGVPRWDVNEEGDVQMSAVAPLTHSPKINLLSGTGAVASAFIDSIAGSDYFRILGLPVYIKDLLQADGALKFQDLNTAAQISFSDGTDYEIDPVLPQTVLGSINRAGESYHYWQATTKVTPLYTGGFSTAGLTITVKDSAYMISGIFKALEADVVVPDNVLSIVYMRASDGTYQIAASYPLPQPEDLPVVSVLTVAGAITESVELRMVEPDSEAPTELVVGNHIGAHVTTLKNAFDTLHRLDGHPGKPTTVRVVGVVDEPSANLPLLPPSEGVQIVGGRNSKVRWTAEEALFDFTNRDDITIRDLDFQFNGNGAPGIGQERVLIKATAGTSQRVRLQNINFFDSPAGVNYHGVIDISGCILSDWLVDNLYATDCSDFAIRVATGAGGGGAGENFVVRDCTFAYPGGGSAVDSDGIKISGQSGVQIVGVHVEAFRNSGIWIDTDTDRAKIFRCHIKATGDYGIELTSDRCRVVGNTIDGVGFTLANSTGIVVEADKNSVIGNDILCSPAGATRAIELTGLADKNVVTGNITNGDGVIDSGVNNVVANNNDF